ncbi:MAG: dynamin family protein [Bacteroidales bacterium]|nr:dynamin family protein [Bacteroidales bacterium]
MSELSEKINEIYEKYKNVDFEKEIKEELYRINDYAEALDDGAFLVVIIGDVNAGKSTFCNLLAHNDICQTDSEECTKKPLFITKGDNVYSTFKKKTGSFGDKKLIFEKILSKIVKGNAEDIDGVEIESTPISEDTVIDTNKHSDYFLTSVAVDEKGLVKDKIFFVDMPGLNGANANFDEFQQIILTRADYIIFIQNSTTDISVNDIKVFEFVQQHNSDVMFSVLMNLYDIDSYNKDNTSKKDAADKLRNIFKKYPFANLKNKNEELSCVVNLGLVKSHTHHLTTDERLDDALNEYTKFVDFIDNISEKVISRSDEIRKPNVEKNIRDRVAKLASQVDDLIKEREKRIKRYDEFVSKSEDLPAMINAGMQYDSEDFQIDTTKIKGVNLPTIDATIPYEETKKLVEDFILSLKNKVVDAFDTTRKNAIAQITKKIGEKVSALNNELHNKVQFKSDVKASKPFAVDNFGKQVADNFIKVTSVLSEPGFLKKMFRWLPGVMSYDNDEFAAIVSKAKNRVINSDNSKSQLLETLEDKFNTELKAVAADYFEELEENIQSDISKKCETSKESMIPNYPDYCSVKDSLVYLKKELDNLGSI